MNNNDNTNIDIDPQNDSILKELAEVGESVYKELVDDNAPNARIPEEVFLEGFLPYFSGQKEVTAKNTIFAQWESIAGGISNEVDVIDNKNQIVVTVPPLVDTTNVLPNVEKVKHLGEVWETYRKMCDNNAAGSEDFLASNGSMKVKEDQNKQRWLNIMDKYGVSPPDDNIKKDNKEDVDDMLEYD